jgi:hypothetical protein
MVGLVRQRPCRQVVGLTMAISRIVMNITAAHLFNRFAIGQVVVSHTDHEHDASPRFTDSQPRS